MVAIGSNLSALWILIANAFMQHPVGYTITDGRAVLTDFSQVVFNFLVFTHFPHVISAGLVTAAFFMLGVSAYHLLRRNETDLFRTSFRMAAIIGVIGTIAVGVFGHAQGQQIPHYQPMKLASLEALYNTENPASLSIIRIQNPITDAEILDIRIPALLSFMEFNRFTGEVQGIYQLQKQYEEQYGPGDYVPPPFVLYWSFRSMVGLGLLMILISLLALFVDLRDLYGKFPWFIKLLPWTIALPYLANTTGWILTEVGRFPWVVYGLVKLQDGVSIVVNSGMLLTSLIGFILVYGLLITVTLYLMFKYAKAGPMVAAEVPAEVTPSLVNPPDSL
jgi:cytochrome d ubiquinol oxidase subunit I